MMGSIVYADITFLLNFIMDFIILWVTVRLTGVPVAYIRLIMAALLGGIYAVGYLYPDISWVYSFPMKVLLSVIMVAIAVWPDTWTDYAKIVIMAMNKPCLNLLRPRRLILLLPLCLPELFSTRFNPASFWIWRGS
jgi:hypothetical protein